MLERPKGTNSESILGGWVKQKDGSYTTAKMPVVPESKEFQEFAEASRARWDIGEYIKVRVKQLLGK